MFKKFFKTLLITATLSMSMLSLNSITAFAKTQTISIPNLKTHTILKTSSKINVADSNVSLSDGQTISETITGAKVYNIKTSDFDQREIFVGSTAPIKTILITPSLSSNIIQYDSGYYRIGSKISTHFIPGMDYVLEVIPQDSSSQIGISVSMNKASNTSWINYGSYTINESNILFGGQADTYDVEFPSDGDYKITVTTGLSTLNAQVYSSFGYNSSQIVNNKSQFIIQAKATGAQNDYSIGVSNISQDTSSGGGYTITIEKLD